MPVARLALERLVNRAARLFVDRLQVSEELRLTAARVEPGKRLRFLRRGAGLRDDEGDRRFARLLGRLADHRDVAHVQVHAAVSWLAGQLRPAGLRHRDRTHVDRRRCTNTPSTIAQWPNIERTLQRFGMC